MKLLITRILIVLNAAFFLLAYSGISLYKHSCGTGHQFIELTTSGGFHQHGCCETSEVSCCAVNIDDPNLIAFHNHCCTEETRILKIDLPFHFDERKSDVSLFPVTLPLKLQGLSVEMDFARKVSLWDPEVFPDDAPTLLHKICRLNT